jgi:hypothetical protein
VFLFCRYLMGLSFCSMGWHESCRIIVSVAVGFRYISNVILSFSFMIVMSKKLILLFCSSSIVNCMLGIVVLKLLRTSWILVVCLLYAIRMSPTYRKYPSTLFCINTSYISVFYIYLRYISENMDDLECPLLGLLSV